MGKSRFAGVDVSSSIGIAALAVLGELDHGYQASFTFWAPEKCAINAETLDLWKQCRWIKIMPGEVLDLEQIASETANLAIVQDFDTLCVDRWGPFMFHKALEKVSKIQLVETSLGFSALTPPTTLFLNLIEHQQLSYTNHVLDWMLGNLVLSRDITQAGTPRIKPNHRESKGSISGIMATILALKLSSQCQNTLL